MINKVSGSYNNPYIVDRKKVTKEADMLPKFMLGDEDEGVVWDRKSQDKKEMFKNWDTAKNKDYEDNSAGLTKIKQKADNQSEHKEELNASIQKKTGVLAGIKSALKKLFDFIWYGDEKNNDISNEKSALTEKTNVSEKLPEDKYINSKINKAKEQENEKEIEIDKDALIRDLIRRKDAAGVFDVLTEHRSRMPARCTNLLTYYDRHGNIIRNSSSNTGRILKGDKDTINL